MLTEIYWLGERLEFVRTCIDNDSSLFSSNMVYDNFTRVQRDIQTIGLNGEINARVDYVLKYLAQYREEEKDILAEPEKTYVLNQLEAINGLIVKELTEMLIFEAVKECALDKDCLSKLSKNEKTVLFDDSVWRGLTELAKSDYSDSAKCILVGAATPATMICLRAAEEEVRKYYAFKTGNTPGRKAWGTLIAELKKEPDIKEELVNHLDYIRKTRNVAQHPDKIYNQREAERIFMNVISMVHDIHEDMK